MPSKDPTSLLLAEHSNAKRYSVLMKRWDAFRRKADAYFHARTNDDCFSGVVRVTQGQTERFAAAYGWASRSWHVPTTLSTRFDTASLTKLFTSVLALQLVDSGDFSLQTRILPYLGLKGTSISTDVTLFHVLTHSSGIADDAEEEDGEDYADLWKDTPNYSITATEQFLPQFAYKPAHFPPGESCRYCNCGFILAGLMIEKALAMPFREAVSERILARAGMKDSGFFNMDTVVQDVAEGSDPLHDDDGVIVGWKKNIYSFPPIGSPDSGAYVTAADLDRFLRAVKNGILLSEQTAKQFFTPQIHYKQYDGWAMRYGLGMWFHVTSDGHVVCAQKEGYNAGVSAVMRYFFDEDINVIILSNMADGAWEPAKKMHSLIVEE